MHSPEERAYMAGLLDGEGNIRIQLLNGGPAGGKRHSLVVTITNTCIPVLEQVAAEWSGNVTGRRHRREGWSPTADARWHAGGAASLLREVQPYLRIKADQCRIALQFADLMHTGTHRTGRLTEQEWNEREGLRVQLQALTNRPVAPKPAPATQLPVLTCQRCGKEIIGYHRLRKYCSDRCSLAVGRDLYLERQRSEKQCPSCGITFTAMSKKQMFCSPKCGRTSPASKAAHGKGVGGRPPKVSVVE